MFQRYTWGLLEQRDCNGGLHVPDRVFRQLQASRRQQDVQGLGAGLHVSI